MVRWFLFILALVVGSAAGLYYGWVVNPARYVDATPAALRADFKADYVLMIAEAYQVEGDMALAARRLAVLGDAPPVEFVQQAMVYGARINPPYGKDDLDLLARLASALQTWNPAIGAVQP